jgi:hypothetical protein
MRYPESVIKAAILHPDENVRSFAVRYFVNGFSSDETIFATVIEAIERYGRDEVNAPILSAAAKLPLTSEAVDWISNELHSEHANQEYYLDVLMDVLRAADPVRLVARKEAFLSAQQLPDAFKSRFERRLAMVGWDAGTCWKELRRWAADTPEDAYLEDCDLPHGIDVAEALARASASDPSAVLETLTQTDDLERPMDLVGPMVVRAAGALRLQAAVPKILENLEADLAELMNEECTTALARIGSPEVLHGIRSRWEYAPEHFGLFCSDVLQGIRSDLAVETIVELLNSKRDSESRASLIDALLGHFASEGVPLARQHIARFGDSIMENQLRSDLILFCEITGERFPEYDALVKAEKRRKEKHRRRMEAIGADPEAFIRYAREQLEKETPSPMDEDVEEEELAVSDRTVQIVHDRPKTGRNDPCPCGSGKKFKRCCLKNGTP